MIREKIVKRLEEYHQKQGIAFMSKHDAVDYFKSLVEIIEEFSVNQADANIVSSPNPFSEQWSEIEKEFDEATFAIIKGKVYMQKKEGGTCTLKSFIKQELASQKSRIKEWILGMKYVFDPKKPREDYLPEVYKHLKSKNEALEDAATLVDNIN